jgi:hypothetical protein
VQLVQDPEYQFCLILETSRIFLCINHDDIGNIITTAVNKEIMGLSTQRFFFSSSNVIATTSFGHTTIIRQHTLVYCLKPFA